MYARSSTIQAQPSAIAAGIAHVRDAVMPGLGGIEGFTGLSLMVDRLSGHCIATRKQAQRCSTSTISNWRSRTYVYPRWPDRRQTRSRSNTHGRYGGANSDGTGPLPILGPARNGRTG
jgi:hypothetical protein